MKGKIRYFGIIEKEVEFPDNLVEIQAKGWDATEEECEEFDNAIKKMVESVRATDPTMTDMDSIVYGENFDRALIEF